MHSRASSNFSFSLFKCALCFYLISTWILCAKSKEWNPEPPPPWAREPPFGSSKITALDVICGKSHMTVRAEFSAPFNGIIFSKGTYGQENCVYVKPSSGLTHTTFNVQYDKCGTKPDLQGKYYENTIVIQYGSDIIEALDEAKRLRCEWFEAYEKPATFRPAIPVADLDVIEMNFQGDEIDCWMSIQEGKGPWAREVSRIVPVGQPMTIVIAINDYNSQFDMRVKSCFAHDGVKPAIQLTDEYGCVLRPKMLTPFTKIRDSTRKATLISYSQFLAFKFPDTMDVQIQCTVEVCRHGCAEACQKEPPSAGQRQSVQVSAEIPHQSQSEQTLVHMSVHEDEPHSLYQDLSKLQHPQTPVLPQSDQTNNYFESGPNDEKQAEDNHDNPSHDHLDYVNPYYKPQQSEQQRGEPQNQPQHDYRVETSQLENQKSTKNKEAHENDDKRHEEAIDKNKKVGIETISLDNLKPSEMESASKILSGLGVNMHNIDFGKFAANFLQGMQQQEISSLLQNDKIKDIAAKFGSRIDQRPVAAALSTIDQFNRNVTLNQNNEKLINSESSPVETVYIPTPKVEESANIEPVYVPPNNETAQSQSSQSITTPAERELNFQSIPNQRHPHEAQSQFHHANMEPIPNLSNLPNMASGNLNMHFPNPMAQVLKVPLQPGMPLINMLANARIQNMMQNAHRPMINLQHSPVPLHHFGPQQHIRHHNVQMIKPIDKRSDIKQSQEAPVPMNVRLMQSLQSQFPHGPRSLRIRRSAVGNREEIGVKKGFQVVTSVDLAFLPNVTTDSAPVYSGRRADIVYGICMPVAGLAAGLSCILWLIVAALASTACMIYKLDRYKKSQVNKQ